MNELTIVPSINHRSPPFPATAILFSKVPGNTAYELMRFDSQDELDRFRALTVAAVRILLRLEDLNDVPKQVLRSIFNLSRPDFPVGEFPDTVENRALVIRLAKEAATSYQESIMSEQNTATATAEPANKTEAKAAAKAARDAQLKAKREEKEAAKAKRAEARGNGVIGTIKKHLDSKVGATQNEILDVLVKQFPERTREGMSSTVKIQFSRLAKSTGREIHNALIEGRGRVYKFKDQGDIPGKVVVATPPTAAAPANNAPTVGDPTGVKGTELAAGSPAPAAAPDAAPKGGAKGGKGAGKQ